MNRYFLNFFISVVKIYNAVYAVFIRYRYAQKINPSISEETVISYNHSRIKGAGERICNAPFKHMYFKADGKITACCRNDMDLFGMISDASLVELWNSSSIEKLRENIDNYNLNGGCNFCNTQLESSNFNAFEGRLYDEFLPVKTQKYPSEITFEISNQCNLECIMCDGNYSSSIRMNREKLPALPTKYEHDFIDKIKDGIPYLKIVRFLGGEPFLITQYIEILEKIITENPSCKIYIQTNGTILNNRVKKIVEHKNVHLSISIDSLQPEKYEYIRKNASFKRLMENMHFFKETADKHRTIININFCVMTNNWEEAIDMLEYCNSSNFTLTYIPVEYPRYLSLRSLKQATLEKILQFYSNPLINKQIAFNKLNGEKLSNLLNYVSYCKEKSASIEKWASLLYEQTEETLLLDLQTQIEKSGINEIPTTKIIEKIKNSLTGISLEERPLYLSTLLIDMEFHPNETPFSHYKQSQEWEVMFTEYLNNLLNCNQKAIYL